MLIKNNIPEWSKSYKLVSTFVRSCYRAHTVTTCHQAITMINLDHYTNTLYGAFYQVLTVRPAIERSQIINLDNLNK